MMLASTDQHNLEQVLDYVRHKTRRAISHFGIGLGKIIIMLESTGSIISSSVVYKIITQSSFIPNDMDIYTPSSKSGTILQILRGKCGYTDINHCHLDLFYNMYRNKETVTAVYWLKNHTGGNRNKDATQNDT